MKKNIFLIFIIIASIITGNYAKAQPYHYPVRPGDDKWDEQKTYVDKVKICNIPEDILKNMSTKDLIETVFNFPFIQDLVYYDDFISSYSNLKTIYNGLEELENRKDAANLLFEIYCFDNGKNPMARDMMIENLLSLPVMLDNLKGINNKNLVEDNDDEKFYKKALLDTCLNKLEKRLEKNSFLVEQSILTSSFLMIRILSHLDYEKYKAIIDEDEEIKKFSETSRQPDRSILSKIVYEIIKYKK